MRQNRATRKRGATLTEVVLGAGISSAVLIAGVGTFLMGMRSWVKGEANMEASSSSQKALRTVSNELREAMSITINSSGTRVDYVRPKREADGTFTNPMVGDGISRSVERVGTTLVIRTGSTTRTLAKDILARKPGDASDYRLFTAPAAAVSRSLTMEIVAGKPGFRAETIIERSRETLYLRNVPQLSR